MNIQENRQFCYAMNKMLQGVQELVEMVENADAEEANEMLLDVLQEWRYFGHHLMQLKKKVECECVENAKHKNNNNKSDRQFITSISNGKELNAHDITSRHFILYNTRPSMTLERATSELHETNKVQKANTKIHQRKTTAFTSEKNEEYYSSLLSSSLPKSSEKVKTDISSSNKRDHANAGNYNDNKDSKNRSIACCNNNAMQSLAYVQTFPHEHHKLLATSESQIPPLWINVWPCFGSFQQCTAPLRLLVHSQYKHMSDVTERASRVLSCMPAPNHLYSPTGEKIYSLEELESDGHYLLFPSTGFYRKEAVPFALLTLFVKGAQDVLC